MPQLKYWNTGSAAYKALFQVKGELTKSGLSSALLELVFLRVSMINGCSYCIKLHSSAAIAEGAAHEQIRYIESPHETEIFGELELASLAWATCLTQLPDCDRIEPIRNRLLLLLSPRQVTDLTVAIGVMNALNRLSISLGHPD